MPNFFNNRGGIDKGNIYVIAIMTLLIFSGYILVGGTLPTKLPKMNQNLVSLIMPSTQPATSSLQMHTFYGVTPTPKPIQTQPQTQPANSPYNPTLIECGNQSTNLQQKPMTDSMKPKKFVPHSMTNSTVVLELHFSVGLYNVILFFLGQLGIVLLAVAGFRGCLHRNVFVDEFFDAEEVLLFSCVACTLPAEERYEHQNDLNVFLFHRGKCIHAAFARV